MVFRSEQEKQEFEKAVRKIMDEKFKIQSLTNLEVFAQRALEAGATLREIESSLEEGINRHFTANYEVRIELV